MSIKVKGIPTIESNRKSVRVIVETPEGKNCEFFAKLEHVLDEKIFASIMHTWDRMVTEKEAQAELKEEDIEKILKKRENMTTEE